MPSRFLPTALLLLASLWSSTTFAGSGEERCRRSVVQRHSALPSAPPVPFGAARQRLRDATGASELTAPLPWPPETAEIMVDAHSIIQWYWNETLEIEQDLNLVHDKFMFWPGRVVNAAKLLVRRYGLDRPPSPWSPVIVVFDLPDPGMTWNGKQVKLYRNLARQGPTIHDGLTFAWSNTYVDTSASEMYRCDREVLYMLEMLSRPYPRRQVLVTADPKLAEQAELFSLVRGPEWFDQELQSLGQEGQAAREALLGLKEDNSLEDLPFGIKNAFAAR